MKFIDLFAGLGGFHQALKTCGFTCVFASEIDQKLRQLYRENFHMECHGDITRIAARDIPAHDLLCAGFPCQPFSKAGKQAGFRDQQSGKLFGEIARILAHHQPPYFILENVPNLKNHDHQRTWHIIADRLSQCGYHFQDVILSPHEFGIPHRRERIFIIGWAAHQPPFNFVKPPMPPSNLKKFFSADTDAKPLSRSQINCLDIWQKFISCLPSDKPLPKFPVWAMEFGATYPLEEKTPFYRDERELAQYRGKFGISLKGLTKQQQLEHLPAYATYPEPVFPKWKIVYLKKNREFWQENRKYIKRILPRIRKLISSWQKLEWNAGDEGRRNMYDYFIQFRSSGVRVKRNDCIPSLVLTATQLPVIGWQKRHLSLHEAQELQGLDGLASMPSTPQMFQALGNAVNTVVVTNIAKQLLAHIKQTARKQPVMTTASSSPPVPRIDDSYENATTGAPPPPYPVAAPH